MLINKLNVLSVLFISALASANVSANTHIIDASYYDNSIISVSEIITAHKSKIDNINKKTYKQQHDNSIEKSNNNTITILVLGGSFLFLISFIALGQLAFSTPKPFNEERLEAESREAYYTLMKEIIDNLGQKDNFVNNLTFVYNKYCFLSSEKYKKLISKVENHLNEVSNLNKIEGHKPYLQAAKEELANFVKLRILSEQVNIDLLNCGNTIADFKATFEAIKANKNTNPTDLAKNMESLKNLKHSLDVFSDSIKYTDGFKLDFDLSDYLMDSAAITYKAVINPNNLEKSLETHITNLEYIEHANETKVDRTPGLKGKFIIYPTQQNFKVKWPKITLYDRKKHKVLLNCALKQLNLMSRVDVKTKQKVTTIMLDQYTSSKLSAKETNLIDMLLAVHCATVDIEEILPGSANNLEGNASKVKSLTEQQQDRYAQAKNIIYSSAETLPSMLQDALRELEAYCTEQNAGKISTKDTIAIPLLFVQNLLNFTIEITNEYRELAASKKDYGVYWPMPPYDIEQIFDRLDNIIDTLYLHIGSLLDDIDPSVPFCLSGEKADQAFQDLVDLKNNKINQEDDMYRVACCDMAQEINAALFRTWNAATINHMLNYDFKAVTLKNYSPDRDISVIAMM